MTSQMPRRAVPPDSPTHISPFSRILHFIGRNPVLAVAAVLAAVTSVIVPPDGEYIGYFDFTTLACLFSTLAVVRALTDIGFFSRLAEGIVRRAASLRAAVAALVAITYFGSMLIANDMALLTFLPLGWMVLESTGNRRYMAMTFILQNTAANLGGMLTPFGNPQNLYIYSYYSVPNGEFVSTMLPPFLMSAAIIAALCFVFPREPLRIQTSGTPAPDVRRTVIYLLLFAMSVAMVFRLIHYAVGTAVVIAALLFLDRRALKEVDYPLLLTFCCFFVFAGNMARIDAVRNVFSSLMESSVLLFSVLSCQLISNVPSAVLLSHFTADYSRLLVGVNIGGVGSIISSMASLITLREYTKRNPGDSGRYLALFSAVSFAILAVLTLFSYLIMR